jgi:drug/metabolite transporter (DMT)-like permease
VATLAPVHWGILLVAGVGQLGVSTVLYGKAMPHVRAIEAIMIPILEPVLNPLWVWLLVGEVPSGWALVGGTMVVGAVTARGLTRVWHTPRADMRKPRAA